jgi:hypothetical protein
MVVFWRDKGRIAQPREGLQRKSHRERTRSGSERGIAAESPTPKGARPNLPLKKLILFERELILAVFHKNGLWPRPNIPLKKLILFERPGGLCLEMLKLLFRFVKL